MSTLSTIRDVIDLDRRMFVRWLRALGSEAALPAVIGAMVLAAQSDAAIQAGAVARQVTPAFAGALVDVYAAVSLLAAVMLGITVGELSFASKADEWLALSGIPRRHRLISIHALAVGARHLIVTAICTVPAAALVWTIDSSARGVAAIALLIALLLTASAVGRIFARLVERGAFAALVVIGIVTIVALLLVQYARVPVLSWLPTHVVALILNGEAAIGMAALSSWIVAVIAIDTVLWRSPGATSPSRVRGIPSISGWLLGVAAIAQSHAALVHAELTKLVRWRRVLVSAVVGAAFIALAIRINLRSPYLLADVAVTLAPCVVVGSLLANIFAVDGAGAQLYYLAPMSPIKAWRAKVAGIAIVALILELGGWAALVVLGNVPTPAGAVFIVCCAAAFFAWCAAIGGLLSVLFPRATDTKQFGRGLIAPEAALLWIPAIGVFVAAAALIAFLYDFGRLPAAGLLIAGAAIVGVSLFVLRTVDRILRTLLHTRAERLTSVLAAPQ